MTRGRKAIPDEIKDLRGNPGNRRLVALEAASKQDGAKAAPAAPIEPPDYLSNERERAIFSLVIEQYQRGRIARVTDIHAYARWASYMHRWISAKEGLGDTATPYYKVSSNHGERLALHPLAKIMFETERMLIALEDRLGLNPAARQNIIRGLTAMPAALGSLFGDEPQPAKEPEVPGVDQIEAPTASESALGFLAGAAGKPH